MKKLIYSLISPIGRWLLSRRGVSIGLCYHRFTPASGVDPVPGMAIDPQQFRMHLDVLKEIGDFVSITDILERPVDSGIRFFLTFDDGYRDNLTELLPILEDYQCPVCIYVVGGIAGVKMDQLPHDSAAGFQPPLLSPDEIKALADHPLVTIGSHTQNHPNLGRLSVDEVHQEIEEGQASLAQILEEPPRDFAVPFGGREDADWGSAVKISKSLGIRSVVSNFGGANWGNFRPNELPQLLKRVSMGPISAPWNVKGWVISQALFQGRS